MTATAPRPANTVEIEPKLDGKGLIKSYPAPEPLATPTDLDSKGVQAIVEALNPLVADAFALYVKTKNFHWHLAASHFRDYHLLFDEHADQIFETIDEIAERVRKVGGTSIRSIGHIAQLQRVEDNNDDFVTPLEMVNELIKENKTYAHNLREAHDVCDDAKDFASASLLENFIDQTERRTWFLYQVSEGTTNTR